MSAIAYQPSILELADLDVRLGPLAGRVRRHPLNSFQPPTRSEPKRPQQTPAEKNSLSAGAWVDHLPGWVRGSDAVFQTLLSDVDWRAERREMYDREVEVPRLLRWYGGHEGLPHPLLAEAREQLSAHYADELGEPFVTAGMCLYRSGRDSVAWHGDTQGRSATVDTMVAIVSFGAPRPLMLRPRGGGASLRFPVGHGDLIVMGGSCQRTWEHSVPKTNRAVGPRVSVQFRPAGVS